MNEKYWDNIGEKYFQIKESRLETVFVFVHDIIKKRNPKKILDYGGGDGSFSIACADLPIKSIFSYDPSPKITKLAKKKCEKIEKINVIQTTSSLSPASFDVISMNAVWMCLSAEDVCFSVFDDIRRLLKPDGLLIISVTHPCFRNIEFSSYRTNFDLKNYLNNGSKFNVEIFDASHKLHIEDTHWNLSKMTSQLFDSGFYIEKLCELADIFSIDTRQEGSPWLVILSRKKN